MEEDAGERRVGVCLARFLQSFIDSPEFGGGKTVQGVDLRDEGQESEEESCKFAHGV